MSRYFLVAGWAFVISEVLSAATHSKITVPLFALALTCFVVTIFTDLLKVTWRWK